MKKKGLIGKNFNHFFSLELKVTFSYGFAHLFVEFEKKALKGRHFNHLFFSLELKVISS